MTDFTHKFEEEFQKVRAAIQKPNILVMGGTGTGKSTLINLILGEELAETGAGAPVTRGIYTYKHDLVTILDSEGYETGAANQRAYNDNIIGYIDKANEASQMVHLVWYCISLPSARFTDLDINIIEQIRSKNIPLAIMLTQVDSASEEQSEEMISEIKKQCLNIDIFETTTDKELSKQLGFVDKIINWSIDHLDEARKTAFISATRAGLEAKQTTGNTLVLQHTVIAAGIGASPIPGSDAALLAPNQIAMLARLASVWNIPKLESLGAGGLLTMLTSTVGKLVAGNLIKLIPGLGSVLGGAINASVASAITYGLGQAVNQQCYRYSKRALNGENVSFADFFNFDTLAPIIEVFFNEKKAEKTDANI